MTTNVPILSYLILQCSQWLDDCWDDRLCEDREVFTASPVPVGPPYSVRSNFYCPFSLEHTYLLRTERTHDVGTDRSQQSPVQRTYPLAFACLALWPVTRPVDNHHGSEYIVPRENGKDACVCSSHRCVPAYQFRIISLCRQRDLEDS